MRGIDEETGEYLSPSRSQNRREALDILELCTKLVSMSKTQLEKLPVPDEILTAVYDAQRIKSHIAHKRRLAFLAKLMRREDDEAVDRLRDALDEDGEAARVQTAALHRAEQWRERLLDEGDEAMTEFLSAFPQADRQELRQLVRNATEERKRNKPPRAFRELFRHIRELLMPEDNASDSDIDEGIEYGEADGDEA